MTKWINSQSVFTIYKHKLQIADRQVIFAKPKSGRRTGAALSATD